MTNISIVGYPKTGTTWLSRLLGDIFDSPVGAIYKPASSKAIATEGQDRPGNYYIGHGHPVPATGKKGHLFIDTNNEDFIILVRRDPRDICVSAMHHWGMDSLQQAIECISFGKWPITHGGGIEHFYEKWDNVKPIWLISYEAMHANIEKELAAIYYFITALSVPTARIREAIKRQSFEARKEWTKLHGDTLNYGKEYQLRFLRKGIVGDWQNHFTREDGRILTQNIGEFMFSQGYIDSLDWWKQL